MSSASAAEMTPNGIPHDMTPPRETAAPLEAVPVHIAVGVMPLTPTHYERLGVPEDSTPLEIDTAWQRLRPQLMPPMLPLRRHDARLSGLSNAELRSDELRLAYAVLIDPQRRAVYDRWLARERVAQRRWWHKWVFFWRQ